MSGGRPKRATERFNFRVYNRTGNKVKKETRKGFTAMANSIQEEMKLVCKITRFMKEYELSLLYDVEDVEEGIREVRKLIEGYESVHVSLKGELEGDYVKSYSEYEIHVDMMTGWITEAKREIRKKKEEEKKAKAEKEEEEEKAKAEKEEEQKKAKAEKECAEREGNERKAKDTLILEEKYFRGKVKQEIGNMYDEDSGFIEDIERNIASVKELVHGYSEIFFRIDKLGQDFRDEFGQSYDEQNETMNLFIREMRKRVQEVKHTDLKVKEDLEISKGNEKWEREKTSKIVLCTNLYDNVCERFCNIECKCETKFEDLTDIQVLEKRKDVKTLASEFNDVLDRITKLSESNPSELPETSDLMVKIMKRKDALKMYIDLFKTNLEKEITDRDLSEEKLKNASILGIKLPKFKGHDSSMDYYTFKSEFEKLISPFVQAKLLPDYLKNNYLEGQALQIVKEVHDLDKIWDRLKLSYGNVVILLANKIGEVESGVPLWKTKGEEKLVQSITKLKNCMMDLSALAKKHKIESSLFHTSNLAKIYFFIGRKRQTDITKRLLDSDISDQQEWEEIIKFLDKEQKVKEKILLFEKSNPTKSEVTSRPKNNLSDNQSKSFHTDSKAKKCVICGKTNHIATVTSKGNTVINYFACDKFAKMTPRERFDELKRKYLCFQCLTPGFKARHEGDCFDKFICPHESHKSFRTGLHILICDKHKNEKANLELLHSYKAKYITNSNSSHQDFSKNIDIAFHVDNDSYKVQSVSKGEELETAIYMLQTIRVDDQNLNLFFDSGCGDMVCRKTAVDCLKRTARAKKILKGPIVLSGVGDQKSICEHGRYQVTIPLHDGKNVNLSGICLDKITSKFPVYPLSEVEQDICEAYVSAGGNASELPKLPKSVGGDTDVMMGIQYYKFWPKIKFRLPSGLSIYESLFANPDGSRGIVGGPHKAFTRVHKNLKGSHMSMSAYLSEIVHTYQYAYKLGLDFSLLDIKELDSHFSNEIKFNDMEDLPQKESSSVEKLIDDREMRKKTKFYEDVSYKSESPMDGPVDVFWAKKSLKCLKMFEEIESAGTEVSYRCVRCRGCPDCKKSGNIECISIQEEVEQGIIDKSVNVNLHEGYTIAKLPFLCDPIQKLAPNEYIARKIYFGQIKKLSQNPQDKQDIIVAEKKLHDLGFVDFIDNLTVEQKNKIQSSPLLYYIPWRAVWNANSLSTPCRPVFDASQPTRTGISLNNLLAKGRNNMNKLLQVVIRWMIRRCAFHTDIQKMYNTIRLEEEHWCYQLYLWQNELNPELDPQIKVIKTLIYGVKSSGNQAERGLRETANLLKNEYPIQNEIVNKDIYVDDCLSGEDSYEIARDITDGLEIMLNRGGFRLKGITFSGFDPPDNLSNDDKSVNVAGMKWFPKADFLSLNISELNFGKKNRGKKSPKASGPLSDTFTRRDCAGRVAEVFDLLGKLTPITAGLKLDLSELSKRKLDWDDVIPDDLVHQWKSNFHTISELGNIRFKRAIVPEDAINLDMETIEMSDSSLKIACSAIYARFKRKDGSYSCQLLFSRSKIVPSGFTIPRAELFAAVLNATTGHIVNLSLTKYIKKRISLTDSQIVLFWINNTHSQLNQWVRNRVIEINRLTKRENWYYIESGNMTADLGTRGGVNISDVSENSSWINGQDWARTDREKFPIKSVKEIKLSKEELKGHSDEIIKPDIMDDDWINKQMSYMFTQNYTVMTKETLDKIGERYRFSNYIVDPCKFRFKKVIRILGLVLLFVKKFRAKFGRRGVPGAHMSDDKLPIQFEYSNDKYLVTQGKYNFPFQCRKGLVVGLTEDILITALNYLYRKASLEIKHFQNKNAYKNISKEKNDILYYTGRILASQQFNNELNLSDVCVDLTMSAFCVPLIDRFSPLAYAIVDEVHWYSDDARHAGIETVMRHVQVLVHICEGRSLIKQFKKQCPRCRYLNKKAIDVAMGPIPSDNLCIAPAFYISQVDIFGPFNSYSNINKRATSKIWFVIFCCCVTGAVDIKVTEDYSTSSFVLAFIRFSCKVGYPKKLLPDAGSQLVKGCEAMKLKFSDISHKLHERGVEFEVCPVGAHYMHGKVERKIKHVKESFSKQLYNDRLSIIQWETLGDQVANSINNLPIAIGNVTHDLENLDLLTPNRLILARNNNRCPVGTLTVTEDIGKVIQRNNDIFGTWFRSWLISYVPTLMMQPKWYKSDKDPKVGDIVLFLKSDKEFDRQYQFGIISDLKSSRDGKIRQIEVEYQNHTEKTKRRTNRGTREVVVIHPVGELGMTRELNVLSESLSYLFTRSN